MQSLIFCNSKSETVSEHDGVSVGTSGREVRQLPKIAEFFLRKFLGISLKRLKQEKLNFININSQKPNSV